MKTYLYCLLVGTFVAFGWMYDRSRATTHSYSDYPHDYSFDGAYEATHRL
jgi:hypothetical protein